ncbi:hypothetical protein GCM10009641_54330 [Mycobacterium cookii]|uniref:Uncharacterized protein n=1 Tax=Mycobacterium cookii TaxID=1775 RepID=A0A7I7KR79_9MYCO|nr:hypothetical protein [Mycobacterium cookii]MCV7332427.1 hypothetical protein [Mycobacterium cookii]BBX44453.1 hypothetical protein MCOO_04680 [Mycobacterium cookii]
MTSPTGVVMAVSAAFAAALIGLANGPEARADTTPEPFQDLFGDTGINTWTPAADTNLVALSPTLAADFAMSVDHYQAGFSSIPDDPFTLVTDEFDPAAFTVGPTGGLLPDNAIGDFAVDLDYTLYATGLGEKVDLFLDALFNLPGYF